MSATARILTGLAAGALIGLLLAWWDPATAVRAADIVQPFGKLWLNALQMTVVPLVLSLVIVGVNTASDAASSGRTARRRGSAGTRRSPGARCARSPDPTRPATVRSGRRRPGR